MADPKGQSPEQDTGGPPWYACPTTPFNSCHLLVHRDDPKVTNYARNRQDRVISARRFCVRELHHQFHRCLLHAIGANSSISGGANISKEFVATAADSCLSAGAPRGIRLTDIGEKGRRTGCTAEFENYWCSGGPRYSCQKLSDHRTLRTSLSTARHNQIISKSFSADLTSSPEHGNCFDGTGAHESVRAGNGSRLIRRSRKRRFQKRRFRNSSGIHQILWVRVWKGKNKTSNNNNNDSGSVNVNVNCVDERNNYRKRCICDSNGNSTGDSAEQGNNRDIANSGESGTTFVDLSCLQLSGISANRKVKSPTTSYRDQTRCLALSSRRCVDAFGYCACESNWCKNSTNVATLGSKICGIDDAAKSLPKEVLCEPECSSVVVCRQFPPEIILASLLGLVAREIVRRVGTGTGDDRCFGKLGFQRKSSSKGPPPWIFSTLYHTPYGGDCHHRYRKSNPTLQMFSGMTSWVTT